MRADIKMPFKTETAIIGVDFGDEQGDKSAVSMMCGNCNTVIQSEVTTNMDEVELKIIKRCPNCRREFKYIDGAISHPAYRPVMK
ncbi:hypothetical protein QTL86_03395 [Cellulosilyticum sp. ST5]|uniref:hypothetical protein n=1 Tax=Cellulosilyticum sp. ST5 TaxID=3055805 RepID=UPI0039779465